MTVSFGVIAFLVVAAFFAGVVDAIAGGGGLLTVPALLSAGLPPHLALGTNKGQAVFGAASSVISFWKRGAIDKSQAPLSFAAGFVGSVGGAFLLTLISPKPLRPLVLILLLIASAIVMFPRRTRAEDVRVEDAADERGASTWLFPTLFLLGMYDGFFGPGVGTLLIVVLSSFFGQSFVHASGNAKVVNFASNVAALGVFAWKGNVLVAIAFPMALANGLGAFFGAKMAVRVGDRLVRRVAIGVLATLLVKLTIDLFR